MISLYWSCLDLYEFHLFVEVYYSVLAVRILLLRFLTVLYQLFVKSEFSFLLASVASEITPPPNGGPGYVLAFEIELRDRRFMMTIFFFIPC